MRVLIQATVTSGDRCKPLLVCVDLRERAQRRVGLEAFVSACAEGFALGIAGRKHGPEELAPLVAEAAAHGHPAVPGVKELDLTLFFVDGRTESKRRRAVSGDMTRSYCGGRYGPRRRSAICPMRFSE